MDLFYFRGRGAWFLNARPGDQYGPRLSHNFVFKAPDTGEIESTDEFFRLYDGIDQKLCNEHVGFFKLTPKDAAIYLDTKDLSHVEKLLPCDHPHSAFSIAVAEGHISKDAFDNCFFLIQKSLDKECFEHRPMTITPYILDNNLIPIEGLEKDFIKTLIAPKNNAIKFERLYFTVQQLATYWNIDVDDVMQLGLTNQLSFIAQADWEYPDHKLIQRGSHTKINHHQLSNIYHATEPFSEIGIVKTSEDKTLIESQCVITYYPGISRFIIDAAEVERFENTGNISKKIDEFQTEIKTAIAPSKLLLNTDYKLAKSETTPNRTSIRKRHPMIRYNESLAVIHAALDELEKSTGKTPEIEELVVYILGDKFSHYEITNKGPENIVIKRRKLILTDNLPLDANKIRRCYRETIFKKDHE